MEFNGLLPQNRTDTIDHYSFLLHFIKIHLNVGTLK